jgi:hypothetical protein
MVLRTTSLTILMLLVIPICALAQAAGDAASRIETAIQRARAAGLPVALLESKVNEGRAKGVPEERIAAAVEQRLESIGRARDMMRRIPDITATDLSVGADALEAGIGEDVLMSLVRGAPGTQRAVAVAVLTQLVHLGEAPRPALEMVRQALQRGPAALQRLPAEVASRQQLRDLVDGVRPRDGGGPGAGRARPGAPPEATPPRGTRPGAGQPRPGAGRVPPRP